MLLIVSRSAEEGRDMNASEELAPFKELYATVGFDEAYEWEDSVTG